MDKTTLPWPEHLARRAVQKLSPYAARGASTSALHLDANESPYAPPPVAGTAEFNRYPAQQPAALLDRLSLLYGVAAEQIMVGRGADEGIEILLRSFGEEGQDSILICTPTFGYYKTCADIGGLNIIDIPLRDNFTWDEAGILAAAKKAKNLKAVFICSPNNPSGNCIAPSFIPQLCKALPDTFIVVDEAYQEFADSSSALPLLSDNRNLVILRTLSKAYAMAGVRAGAAIAHPEIIAIMRRVLPPYPISRPQEKAILAALTPSAMPIHAQRMAEWRSERDRLREALPKSPFVKTLYPTEANFFLLDLSDYDAALSALAQAGIKIRTYPALPGKVRISIGSPEENSLMLSAMGVGSPKRAERVAEIHRKTKETDIAVRVNLDDGKTVSIDTGIGFFDHMLESFAKHSGVGLTLACEGDLHIDAHHTIEDCALALGTALKDALGDKAGIGRFGFVMPMDETQARVAIDISGRPALTFKGEFPTDHIGAFPTEMCPHFFESLAQTMGAAIQIEVEGENSHHMVEASFKGVARALRPAFARSGSDIPSTKGVL